MFYNKDDESHHRLWDEPARPYNGRAVSALALQQEGHQFEAQKHLLLVFVYRVLTVEGGEGEGGGVCRC